MASELRVNTSTNRVGLGTITYTDTGPIISGITTGNNFKTGTTNVHSTGVELVNINTAGGAATFGGDVTVNGDELFIADSIKHVGDTDTSISFPSNDTIRLITAGGERVRINSDGEVGIGTDNPATEVHVQSTAPVLTVKATNASSGLRLNVLGQTGGANGQLFRVQRDSTTKLQLNDDGDLVITGDDNAELKLICGTSSGNNILAFLNSSSSTRGNITYDSDNDFLLFNVNQAERVRITSSGQLGIGIVSPGAMIHAYHATTNTIAQFESGDAGAGILLKDNTHYTRLESTNGTFKIDVDAGQQIGSEVISFQMNTSEKLRIKSDGSILIGNTNGGSEVINMVGGGGGILISRSASGSPNDGQTLGDIGLNSYSNTQTCSTADVLIRGQADGNHSGSSAGSALLLFTKPASTGPGSAPTERLRITKDGHLRPAADNTYDLGAYNYRWKDLFVGDAHFSNRDSANEVDGTWGDWTLQEGESKIFMINNRTGKKYSLVMEEA